MKRALTQELELQLIQERLSGVTRKDLAAKYGLPLATVKTILLRNKVVIPVEQRNKNAYAGLLATDPAVLLKARNARTADSYAKQASSIRATYAANSALKEEKGRQSKEWWSRLSEDDRVAYLLKRKMALDKSPLELARRENLKSGKGDANGKTQQLLKRNGVATSGQLMTSYAHSKGGVFVGPYIDSTTLTTWKCQDGHTFEMRPNNVQQGQWCPSCSHVGPSKGQLEIGDYIKSLGFEIQVGNRSLIFNKATNRFRELDIYVPSKQFAIEYNGLLWHSDYHQEQDGRHEQKALLCREKGIKLLAIFEDEWIHRQDLIKAMIRHRLGVLPSTKLRASQLELRRMDKNVEFESFFEHNHLDGHSKSSYAYGLFWGNRLVSCMSIRTNHQAEREIARFATAYDVHVHGSAGRLVNAIKLEEPSITTFSNNRLSEGNVYRQLGFELVQENGPSYWYTDGNTRIGRFKCRRINDPEILARFPHVEHTERAQTREGLQSLAIFGDQRPLYKIEDYGHRKWRLVVQ